ncbi:unconventional myosin-ie [Anaeramoeba ignava]|uniref:Unconventional myosin-ie n=1 Tax=Anaeramoeba ignava TaxID=1746090 RepID=A0A9Q0LC16_ANAIG|nr:unconventional myosin-ie [Anaeramoeba ignava]
MGFTWESTSNRVGVDDLVLLTKINESQIVENLKKRLQAEIIYTYIGFVLIAVNPYRKIDGMYSDEKIKEYRGKYSHELAPHIYSLADRVYHDLTSRKQSQAIIITGESGAGKTESAKLIMQYISAVSGGGPGIEKVKQVILQSNQILESFGNATTLQNNNSSRFGKYLEIQFNEFGSPEGGRVRNYLLEKSRVVYQQLGERTFHIFYQLTMGAPKDVREYFGITSPDDFFYTNQGQKPQTDGMDETKEYNLTRQSMTDIGLSEDEQNDLFRTVAAIIHLGNITFYPDDNGNSKVQDENQLSWTAGLLGVDPMALSYSLTFRTIQTGMSTSRRGTTYNVPQNVDQAYFSRDALAKAIYTRMFDYVVDCVNKALGETDSVLVLGILDIFGFEIFKNNGFEQFCINFVNEKLQQIFIELTLKMEQEEYVKEGIKWEPIDYFDNKICCDLIEGKKPPGIITILNDVCLMPQSQIQSQDEKFLVKLDEQLNGHQRYMRSMQSSTRFSIHHYAGEVEYEAFGFCEKNTDTLFNDLIQLAQSSDFGFLVSLFPEKISSDNKKRPTSTGTKVRENASELVENLMKCVPSYIRCIRPNPNKKPCTSDTELVTHQVRYLGLLENVRVRRAGFAFRQEFDRFVHHYGVLCDKTWPYFKGPPEEGCKILLNYIQLDQKEWQLGKTKVFIRHPESLFLIEEMRERKYHESARKIQKCYRMWKARKYFLELRAQASDLLFGKKQRRRLSINRVFNGDYINYMSNPKIRLVMEKANYENEKLFYSNKVYLVGYSRFRKIARREDRDLLVTENALYSIALVSIKVNKKKIKQLQIARRIPLMNIQGAQLSTLADSFVNLKISDYDFFIEDDKKTELITVLKEKIEAIGGSFTLTFSDSFQSKEKKGNFREISFKMDSTANPFFPNLKGSSKSLSVGVIQGLSSDTRPRAIAFKGGYSDNSGGGYSPTETNSSPPPRTGRGPPPVIPTGPRPTPRSRRGPPPITPRARSSSPTNSPKIPPPRTSRGPPPLTPRARSTSPRSISPRSTTSRSPPPLTPRARTVSPKSNSPTRGPPIRSRVSSPTRGPSVTPRSRGPPPIPRARSTSPKTNEIRLKALFTYEATSSDELTFSKGDIIILIKKDDSGWWHGEINGQKGTFPYNYVEQI